MTDYQANPFLSIEQRFDKLEAILTKLSSEVVTPPKEPFNPHERLTRKQIKEQYKVSYSTLHNAMKTGRLPFEKIGRKTIFKRVNVEAWTQKKA